jgi:hypothetical protein
MVKIYYSKQGRLGNNIIQYMAAKLICKTWGHELTQWKCELEKPIEIGDTNIEQYGFSWNWFCEALLEGEDLTEHPLKNRNIWLNGFFQRSDIYVFFRPWLRSLFTIENTDSLNFSVRVCDLMRARGYKTEGVTLHLRLDDFQDANQVVNPGVYLTALRKLPRQPLTIVVQKPTRLEEEFYIALFDSFHPHIVSDKVLEDHATLRQSTMLITSNSTFAWTAAFLGDATRYIVPCVDGKNQSLTQIESSDTLLKVVYANIKKYTEHTDCISGEDIQALCDVTILTREKREFHVSLGVSRANQLLLEDTWSTHKDASIIFVYTDLLDVSIQRVCEYFNPRLLVIHNGDTEPSAEAMQLFLYTFPDAHIYAQNNVVSHPRIHSLPMGIQNRMWRKCVLNLYSCEDKSTLAYASHFSNTHPSRASLMKTLKESPFPGLHISSNISHRDYFHTLQNTFYSFCPPGNAHDTHRLWESLYCGATPIVLRTPFIERLLDTCPSLDLLVLDTFDKIDVGALKPVQITTPVYLHLRYWQHLFETYCL